MENIDLEFVRGDDFGFIFEIQSEDEELDLTGYKFDLWIVPTDVKDRPIKLSTNNGITINGNNLEFIINAELTQKAKWLQADYDLQMRDLNNLITTIVKGRISLIPDITKVGRND